MSDVFFLVLRRLRAPLILLITVYAIAITGLTLIPGQDPDGNVWHMSFFHAFYFVSFMGSTIGFGEIPYPFVDAQRIWVALFIYATVISWLYAIGNALTLIQDPTFKQAIAEKRFTGSIRRNPLPFYIICGYGQTGRYINEGLTALGLQTVIVDKDSMRTRSLELDDLAIPPIVLTADATQAGSILSAGVNHPHCKGVIAVTEDDHVNLKIAVTCKLLRPKIRVVCRSEVRDEAANMASFGTDEIVDPFMVFAKRLDLLAHKPELYRIHNWFINQHSRMALSEKSLPRGKWIICGFGRLGKAIYETLQEDGLELVVVDPDPVAHFAPENTIVGRGTEADTLRKAGIEDASLILAATDDDANNLSILITAKQLNSDLYTIGRVGKVSNQILFERAQCDFIMRRSHLIANEVLTTISRPLVSNFLKYSEGLNHQDICALTEQITQLTNEKDPVTWRLAINDKLAPAIYDHIESGLELTVGQVCHHVRLPESECLPLLLLRSGVSLLLPNRSMPLEIGDELLVCGRANTTLLPQRLRYNDELIDTLINDNQHSIPFLRWWSRRAA